MSWPEISERRQSMKIDVPLWSTVAIFTFALQPSSLRAQGALAPPGPPAATMKSLDQIEARTPISGAPFIISNPGSYYLTTNLTVTIGNAIFISTNQVTLDLNGFTISSTDNANLGSGIIMNATNSDITVRNGHITSSVTYDSSTGAFSGTGFLSGIDYYPAMPSNVRVTGVTVSGCLSNGINLGQMNSTLVESCTVRLVGNTGIVADNVSHCTANLCGHGGITARVASDCLADTTGAGNAAIAATTANNCFGVGLGGANGIYTIIANNCSGTSASATGLTALGGVATGCNGASAFGTGMTAYIANGCVVGGATNITYRYNMP
jgi:hypothetical protein